MCPDSPTQLGGSNEQGKEVPSVIASQIRRILSILAGTALLVGALGVAPAMAAQPGWTDSYAEAIPEAVSPGQDAGYVVRIFNKGPGNIASLYLVSDRTPSFVDPVYDAQCSDAGDGPLFCSFGGVGTDAIEPVITLTVAFSTAGSNGSSFKVTFQLNATGATLKDKGGNSRGDSHTFVGETALSSDRNYGGGFIVDDTTVQNNQSVNNQNKQATKLESLPLYIPATVLDGSTVTADCLVARCSNAFGEWSRISALSASGDDFDSPFKVVLTIVGSAVPGQANAGNIVLLHTNDLGTGTDVIGDSADERCASANAAPDPYTPCVFATKNGNNWQITAWLFHNGSLRGGW